MTDKNKVILGVDKSYEDVLKLHEAKRDVFFSSKVGDFISLTDDQYKSLPRVLKDRYTAAKVAYEQLEQASETDESMTDVDFAGKYASTMNEYLEVANLDPTKDYYLSRENRIADKLKKGYRVSTGAKGTVFGNNKANGAKRTGLEGELILVERPKKITEERNAAKAEMIEQRFVATEDANMEAIERLGGKAKSYSRD